MTPNHGDRQREALVRAAKQLLDERGFQQLTLPDVALRAHLTLAEVQANFQTKEILTEAVVAADEEALLEMLAHWSRVHAEPRRRLRCLVRAPLDAASPLIGLRGSERDLCRELEKEAHGTPLCDVGARLLSCYLDWAEAQFTAAGYGKPDACALAEQLLSSVQGLLILADSLAAPGILKPQILRVERWLRETVRELD